MNGNSIPSIRLKDLDITYMKTKSHKYDFGRLIHDDMQKLMNTIINEMN